jgi:hypothetical protein
MAEWGAINAADTSLVQRADSPQKAFELLRAHLTRHHLEAPEPAATKAQAPQLAKTRR